MNTALDPIFFHRRISPEDKLNVLRLQRLRYEVYKEELGYKEVPANNARLDRDEFEGFVDQHFAMFEAHTSKPVGCIRLIRGPKPFMAQRAYGGVFDVPDLICDETSSESSRFTFAREYRTHSMKSFRNRDALDFSYALTLVKEIRQYCHENKIRWNYAVTSWIPYISFSGRHSQQLLR
ncbi:MAG: GNAT family N-acetyltransferase [Proteobacteria bacterium]|nr:GNAT family N-acetyltransferase [Pseudomonadota bacterium]